MGCNCKGSKVAYELRTGATVQRYDTLPRGAGRAPRRGEPAGGVDQAGGEVMGGREPLRVYNAVLAGWLVLLSGSAFTDLLPMQVVGLLTLSTAAVTTGVTEYLRGRVTPLADPRDVHGVPLVPSQRLRE